MASNYPEVEAPAVLGAARISRWFFAAALLAAFLLTPAAASAEDPVGCGYGTGGPFASNLCWFDMSAYNDAQARSPEGQQMSITLPGDYVVKFKLTSRLVPGTNWRGVESRSAPLESRFAFGVSGYVAIQGKPVLYSQGGPGPNGVELKLSEISVVDAVGQPVTGYSFAIADAENNVSGENFTWSSDKPLSLLGVLNEKSAVGCRKGLSGLGTTSVTCIGQGTEPGLPNPRYDDVVIGADTPSSIALSMNTFARSGVAFAIMTSKVRLTKDVVGRVKGSDSFDVSVTSPEGSTLASATTGPADTATTGELTVLPLSSGASYTLSEAVTPASGTRQSDYSRSWSCTNNGAAEPSLPSGSGPSVSVSPAAGDFIACTVTNTQLAADLSVQKTVSAETAATGSQLTYTVQVENEGPSGADATVLEDTLPAGVSYVSDNAGCDSAALPVIKCDLGTLLSGESRSVEIVAAVQPAAAGSLQTNVAKVGALQPDSDPADNESSASTAVEPFADLAIAKSVSPGAVGSLGEHITYTIVAENRGESESPATTVTDTLPAGLGYVSNDASCNVSALPTITCAVGALAKGESRTIHVVGEVEGSAAGEVINNSAAVSGPVFDPDPTNNEATAALEVEPLSDLAITKTTAASTAKPGENITYFIKAENKGPTTDLPVHVTDTLPPGLEYVSDTAACDTSALPTVTCEVGMLEKGQSLTITLVAKVIAASGTIENTAEVSGTNPDPELANNTSTAKTTVEPVSDLAIVKTAATGTVKPGETLAYTLEVENNGSSTSPATTVTDTLPAALTHVSNDAGCTVAAQREISCDLGSLASGATRTIHVLTAVGASASGTIANTATVSGSNFDAEPDNNESTASTAVEQIADLAISKAASASIARPGDSLTYTLIAENKGPSTSNPTTVADTLPAGVSYVSDDGGCNTSALPAVSCELGSLANGEAKTIHIVAEVTATTGSVENGAQVEGPLPDPEPANDEATAVTAVEPVSDLVLHKSAAAAVKPGGQLTYSLEVENKGPSASGTMTVTDTLPAGLTYVSDDAGCDTSALPTISCTVGALASGSSVTVQLVTAVEAGAGGTIQNTAGVSGPNPDPEADDNEASATTTVTQLASDLALNKTATSNGAVSPGDTIAYTLTTTNNGPDPSPMTVLTDNLPAGLAYVSDDAGCDATALPQVKCNLGTLASGGTRSVHLLARVDAIDGRPIHNTAEVSGANADPDPSDNTASAETSVATQQPPPPPPPTPAPATPAPPQPAKQKSGKKPGEPRLVLEKTAGTGFARPGAVVAYKITLRNTGDGAARRVRLCDEPPPGLTILRSEPAGVGERSTCWRLATLAAGAKRVFRVTAQVADDADGAERNVATVSALNVKGVRTDAAKVKVKPLPSTSCRSQFLRAGASNDFYDEVELLC